MSRSEAVRSFGLNIEVTIWGTLSMGCTKILRLLLKHHLDVKFHFHGQIYTFLKLFRGQTGLFFEKDSVRYLEITIGTGNYKF